MSPMSYKNTYVDQLFFLITDDSTTQQHNMTQTFVKCQSYRNSLSSQYSHFIIVIIQAFGDLINQENVISNN